VPSFSYIFFISVVVSPETSSEETPAQQTQRNSKGGGVDGIDEREEEGDRWQDRTEEEMITSFVNNEITDDELSDDQLSDIEEEEISREPIFPLHDQEEDDEAAKIRKALLAEALGFDTENILKPKNTEVQGLVSFICENMAQIYQRRRKRHEDSWTKA
jgi:hypothetical protein